MYTFNLNVGLDYLSIFVSRLAELERMHIERMRWTARIICIANGNICVALATICFELDQTCLPVSMR